MKHLTEKADRLTQKYKIKREEIRYKEVELSGWQKKLREHENEYEEFSRKKGHRESQSILKQVSKCETNMQECRELIKNLKDDISRRREGLKAVVDAIISCEVQLKITLNELSHCQEILKMNEGLMDDELKRILNSADIVAQHVKVAAITTAAVSFGVAALSILSGDLAFDYILAAVFNLVFVYTECLYVQIKYYCKLIIRDR